MDINLVEAVIEACFDFADIIRASGIDVRVEAVIPEPAQEGATGSTYETLGDLVQEVSMNTERKTILVHRYRRWKGVNGNRRVMEEIEMEEMKEERKMEMENRENENGNIKWDHGRTMEVFIKWLRVQLPRLLEKCKPHNFSRTEGVVELTPRVFEKMEIVFTSVTSIPKYK
ncbi:hypothetical protein Tco_1132466 [Tanacetum coccineum]|uniref:Uncharacterized protein n=1 Tax=Tanacetum coccineum TaxID=301880 RepID=A0ABQ5JDQ3_9ASTR